MYPCLGLIATLTITYLTRKRGVKKGLSPRLCLCLAALSSDMAVVSGRGVSYLLGGVGRDVGYLLSGILLNLGCLGGTIGFAVLCYVSSSHSEAICCLDDEAGLLIQKEGTSTPRIDHTYVFATNEGDEYCFQGGFLSRTRLPLREDLVGDARDLPTKS